MATGLGLVAVRPSTTEFANSTDLFLDNHDVLNEAPREIVLQFSPGQVIDPTTLSQGILVTRAGADAAFTPASASSDFNTDGRVVVGRAMG